jgi:hypothetical protein
VNTLGESPVASKTITLSRSGTIGRSRRIAIAARTHARRFAIGMRQATDGGERPHAVTVPSPKRVVGNDPRNDARSCKPYG